MYYILISNTTCNHKLNSLFYYFIFLLPFFYQSSRKRKQKRCAIPNKKRKGNREDGVIKELIRKFAQLAI